VSRKPLLELLQTVSKAVAVRTPRPILTGILLQVTTSDIVATAYDMELGIKDSLGLESGDSLHVDVPGSVVLPARQFVEIMRKLVGEQVTLEADAQSVVKLRDGQFECAFHGFSGGEFPHLPNVTSESSLAISSRVLKEAIESTAFAASKQETRPIFTGVFVESTAVAVRLSATDSLRLATRRIELVSVAPAHQPSEQVSEFGAEYRAIIPAKSLLELAHILPDDDTAVELRLSGSHCMFKTGSLELFTRIIDGNYVNVEHLIPKNYQTELSIGKDEFVRALERAVVFAGNSQEVQLVVQDEAVMLATESAEMGRLADVVAISSKVGANLRIAFNVKSVLEAIRSCRSESLILKFSGSNTPFVISPQDTIDLTHVISPMVTRF